MIIDSKLPGFKSYISDNRLTNGGIKTTIDQAAVAPSEQNNVDLELDDGTNNQDQYKKKKEEHKESKEHTEEKVEKIVQSNADVKGKNLKLLNLL